MNIASISSVHTSNVTIIYRIGQPRISDVRMAFQPLQRSKIKSKSGNTLWIVRKINISATCKYGDVLSLNSNERGPMDDSDSSPRRSPFVLNVLIAAAVVAAMASAPNSLAESTWTLPGNLLGITSETAPPLDGVVLGSDVADLYRLRSESMPLGRGAGSGVRLLKKDDVEPVEALSQQFRKGCGGPQCVAVLLRPSATLECAFLVGLIGTTVVARRRGEVAKKLQEVVAMGEEERRKSEEAVEKMRRQLAAQEKIILDLLQGTGSTPKSGLVPIPVRTTGQSQGQGQDHSQDQDDSRGDFQTRTKSRSKSKQGKVREPLLSEHVLSSMHADVALPTKTETAGPPHGQKRWIHDQGHGVRKPPGSFLDSTAGTVLDTRTDHRSHIQKLPESTLEGHIIAAPSLETEESVAELATGTPSTSQRKGDVADRSGAGADHFRTAVAPPKRAPTSWRPVERKQVAEKKRLGLVAVADTNCFLHQMRFVRLLSKVSGLQAVVPLAVLGELDGLQQNSDPRTGFSARKAVRFFAVEMMKRNSWLRGQRQTELLRAHRTRKRRVGSSSSSHGEDKSEPWRPGRRVGTSVGRAADDDIIDCCLFFAEEGQNVVLLTDDKALQVKAMIHDVEVYSIETFLQSRLSLDALRHLK